MSFEIRFSPKAEDTFDAVVDQLTLKWGDKYVNKFKLKATASIKLIAQTPLIYPIAKENPSSRKCVLHKNCSMYYRVNGNIVEVLYFWDNRQDPITFP